MTLAKLVRNAEGMHTRGLHREAAAVFGAVAAQLQPGALLDDVCGMQAAAEAVAKGDAVASGLPPLRSSILETSSTSATAEAKAVAITLAAIKADAQGKPVSGGAGPSGEPPRVKKTKEEKALAQAADEAREKANAEEHRDRLSSALELAPTLLLLSADELVAAVEADPVAALKAYKLSVAKPLPEEAKARKTAQELVAAAKAAADAARLTKPMLRGLVWGAGARTSDIKESSTTPKLAKLWTAAVAKHGGIDEAIEAGTKERRARKTGWHRYMEDTPMSERPRTEDTVKPLDAHLSPEEQEQAAAGLEGLLQREELLLLSQQRIEERQRRTTESAAQLVTALELSQEEQAAFAHMLYDAQLKALLDIEKEFANLPRRLLAQLTLSDPRARQLWTVAGLEHEFGWRQDEKLGPLAEWEPALLALGRAGLLAKLAVVESDASMAEDDDALMDDAEPPSPPPIETLLYCIAHSRALALARFIATELDCVRLEFEERNCTLPYVSPRGRFAKAPCERVVKIKGKQVATVAAGTVVMSHEHGQFPPLTADRKKDDVVEYTMSSGCATGVQLMGLKGSMALKGADGEKPDTSVVTRYSDYYQVPMAVRADGGKRTATDAERAVAAKQKQGPMSAALAAARMERHASWLLLGRLQGAQREHINFYGLPARVYAPGLCMVSGEKQAEGFHASVAPHVELVRSFTPIVQLQIESGHICAPYQLPSQDEAQTALHVERKKDCDVCFGNNEEAVALRKKQQKLLAGKAGRHKPSHTPTSSLLSPRLLPPALHGRPSPSHPLALVVTT